jgi:hypothetical protein
MGVIRPLYWRDRRPQLLQFGFKEKWMATIQPRPLRARRRQRRRIGQPPPLLNREEVASQVEACKRDNHATMASFDAL